MEIENTLKIFKNIYCNKLYYTQHISSYSTPEYCKNYI